MKIIYTPAAIDDLSGIKLYISNELKNPIAANNVTTKIIKDINNLSDFPQLGLSVQEKTGRETDTKCLISGNYGVVYLIDSNIKIIRILDLRMDYMHFIFIKNN